jgi:large subunit ribosomal protein L21
VLALMKDDATVLGTPYVAGASVKAQVAGEGRYAKVLVFKKLPRKSSRKIHGHRQFYTTIKITDIVGG